MKSFQTQAGLLAILCTTISANPVKRQSGGCILNSVMNPNTAQVQASINQWNSDVITVNSFLNNASAIISDSSTLVTQAMDAARSANDEPCQLMTLASESQVNTIPAFACAVTDLMNVFMDHVIDPLNTIISDPTNTTSVQNSVNEINGFRCCNVLPDVDILWSISADNDGISNQVPTSAQRENACSSIKCTDGCSALSTT